MERDRGETAFQRALKLAISAVIGGGVVWIALRGSSTKVMEHYHVDEKKKCIAGKHISINSYEDKIACDVIDPRNIDVDFNSIGGLQEIKKELRMLIILPLTRPALFTSAELLVPEKGILLHGPPGTGKTMLAKAIAKESGAVFINVKVSNLKSKTFGDSEKLVAALFSLAHKLEPSIIFIDEVDGFLGARRSADHETVTSMKNVFMGLWDGFETNKHARVMVLGATNRKLELDDAILRRFSQSFEIGKPDQNEREEILKIILKGQTMEDNINFYHLAGLCVGYTGSDLSVLCKTAGFLPIRDAQNSGRANPAVRPVSQSDLEEVFSRNSTRSSE